MKYPSYEVRKARAVFTGKLKSILQRLDACATGDISPVFLGRRMPGTITVTEVWVVGSYARGAGTCGDLDVVVRTTGGYATSAAVNHRLLGKLPDVRVYVGTPEANESGIPFPEAVKVWESGMDWAAALAAIPEDPHAGRFPRKTDGLPLRTEQLRVGADLAEQVVDEKEKGVLTWTFIPLGALSPAAFTDADSLERLARMELSSAKRRLLPYIHAFLATLPDSRSDSWKCNGDVWLQGGTWVLLGAGLPNYDLLNQPGIARMAVMPDLNVRGPNGIWVLERGPAHPLTKAFQNAAGWFIGHAGTPVTNIYLGEHEHDYVSGVTAFDSRDDALTHIAEVYGDDDVDEFGPPPEPMYLAGADYLSVLAGIEVVDYFSAGKAIAFNQDAAYIASGLEAECPGVVDIPNWFETFFAAAVPCPAAQA